MKTLSSLSSPASFILFIAVAIHSSEAQRPFGGGNFGDRPGFPGLQPEFVSKTCDAQWECPVHDGISGDGVMSEDSGIFVCRQTYHPIYGTLQKRTKCISMEEAYETDECGCCGDDCPVIPALQTISCASGDEVVGVEEEEEGAGDNVFDSSPQNRRRGLKGRSGNPGRRLPENTLVVCRQHYNPYTGIQDQMSMYIDPEKSLEGDVCGCCDGDSLGDIVVGRPQFARPDHVELTWCDANASTPGTTAAENEYTSCTLPQGRQGDLSSTTSDEGVFVCRSMANMLTGVAESQTLCIAAARAWETDQCGCCGQDCPEQTLPVDLECNVGPTDQNGNTVPVETITEECQFANGDSGYFACRFLFHPLDGEVIQRTLCIKDDDEDGENAWATDQCGCCGASCPEMPAGGFPRVDQQMMELSLEEEDGMNVDFGGGPKTGEGIIVDDDSDFMFGIGLGLTLLFMAVVGIAMMIFPRHSDAPRDTIKY